MSIVTLLSDTFTDANGTALTAHTMDLGTGWIADTGTFQIQSNKATLNSANDGDLTVTQSGASDITVAVDIVPQSSALWESTPQVVVRYADTNNHWVVHPTSAGTAIQLYEKTGGGAYTLRATAFAGFIAGTTYALKVVCQGPSISAYINNVLAWTYASATSSQTATKVGLRNGQNGVVITKCTWDNFAVTASVPERVPGPLTYTGPPLPGSPWFHLRAAELTAPSFNAPLTINPPSPLMRVHAGPADPRTPWFKYGTPQLLLPNVQGITPPAANPPSLVQEVKAGPPMLGAPWSRIIPPLLPATAQVIVLPSLPPSPLLPGPPIPGSPWFKIPVVELNLPGKNAPANPANFNATPMPGQFVGPPLAGAPWFRLQPGPAGPKPGTSPVPTPVRKPDHLKPFLARVPNLDDVRRLGRATDLLAVLINSMFAQGFLQLESADSYRMISGGFAVPRPPMVTDDASIGATIGCSWVDTSAKAAYICVDNSLGSAVWRGPV